MRRVARDVARTLRSGGRLILAQHQIDFYDFAQHARGIHGRFLRDSGGHWRRRTVRRTARWIVEVATLV